MLRALNIRNFALVDSLDIEFGPGLTVITGESGAGKSILLDALGLVLGARAKSSQRRPGTASCDVGAEFDVGDRPQSLAALRELDLFDTAQDTTCLVRRTASERRSRAFVNGRPTTLAVLQSLTEPLVDIHGQHEHRQLLDHDMQRRLLDEFGVDAELRDAVSASYHEREALAKELAERRAAVAARSERASLLGYQVDELAPHGEALDEVEELTARHKRLGRAQELMGTIGGAVVELEEDLTERLSRLANLLEGIDDDHASLSAAAELASSAHMHLDEALAELRRYLSSFPEDDTELAELDQTLTALHELARKHRVATTDLGAHLHRLRAELATLADGEADLAALAERAAAAEQRFQTAAAALSKARRQAAPPFARHVTATLAELGMPGASLSVAFAAAESAAGQESVQFQAVTNPRYGAADLADIASGGELSRISLAIQIAAAERSRLPCLVLDEADIGVGGTTADVLGRLLRRLSRNTQVIAITHAPQIAALGDAHLKVVKTSAQDTVIHPLEGTARTEELARMLGGRTVTDESRAYAETLLADADGCPPPRR